MKISNFLMVDDKMKYDIVQEKVNIVLEIYIHTCKETILKFCSSYAYSRGG